MAKTYSVSLPDAEARQAEIEARRLGITVPELIRRKMKGSVPNGEEPGGISRAEFDILFRELLIVSSATRLGLEDAKNTERDAKVRTLVKNGVQELERIRKEAK
jgi:hypothetical protein